MTRRSGCAFQESENLTFISAVDISRFPEIAICRPTFHDFKGSQNDMLTIPKNNGANTIRLKLWVDPSDEHAVLILVFYLFQ